MRHASITTTVQFYANVDRGAEEEVRRRNSLRNTAAQAMTTPHEETAQLFKCDGDSA
jgi:hypothetical protein